MPDAGAVEQQPLRRRNRALVADRQRGDHAGVRPARRARAGCDRVSPRGRARRGLRRARRMHRSGDWRRPCAHSRWRADRCASSHASTSKPCGLTVPCGRFNRTATDQRSPACSTRHVDRRCAGREAAVPGKRHARRHAGFGRDDAFDGEGEACAAIGRLRQLVDYADKADIATLPRGRQRVGEPKLGAPRGVEKAAAAGRERENGDCVSRAARRASTTSSANNGTQSARCGSGSDGCVCSTTTPSAKASRASCNGKASSRRFGVRRMRQSSQSSTAA